MRFAKVLPYIAIAFLIALLIGAPLHTSLVVSAATPELAPIQSSGVDVVFMLDVHQYPATAGLARRDFTAYDPDGVRLNAVRFAQEFLIQDSLAINKGAQHWLGVVLFDRKIEKSTGIALAPGDETQAANLRTQLDQVLGSASSLPNCPTVGDHSARCGADLQKAFAETDNLLTNRPANRTQIVVLITADGCASASNTCDTAPHKQNFAAVSSTIKQMQQRNVQFYVYASKGNEGASDNKAIQNYYWRNIAGTGWTTLFNSDPAKGCLGNNSEAVLLEMPLDFMDCTRKIILSRIDLNPERVSVKMQKAEPSNQITVQPYASYLKLVYFKQRAGLTPNLDPSGTKNQPPSVQDNKYFTVITVPHPKPGTWDLRIDGSSTSPGDLVIWQGASRGELQVTAHTSTDGQPAVLQQIPLFQIMDITFTPRASTGETLFYAESQYAEDALSPMAVFKTADKTWRVPLTLDRTATGGSYRGQFWATASGDYTVSIALDGTQPIGLLQKLDQSTFTATDVRVKVIFETAKQFQPWVYGIKFVSTDGSQEYTPAQWGSPPDVHVQITTGKGTQEVSSILDAANQFASSYTFTKNDKYQLAVVATLQDTDQKPVTVAALDSNVYAVSVTPAHGSLEVDTKTARQYTQISVDYRLEQVNSQALPAALTFTALVAIKGNPAAPRAFPLLANPNKPGYFSQSFYLLDAGTLLVDVEGAVTDSTGRTILVTQNQADEAAIDVSLVTIGLTWSNAPRQFEEASFTLTLDSNGQPLNQALPDALKLSVETPQIPGAVVRDTDFKLVAGKYGQWTGKATFVDFGDQKVGVKATVQAVGLAITGDLPRLPLTLTDPQTANIKVTPLDPVYKLDNNDQVMLEPIQVSLDMPQIAGQNGNQVLRTVYGMALTFTPMLKDGSRTFDCNVPPDKIPDSAPFGCMFTPTVPGEYTIVATYRSTNGASVRLDAPSLALNVRQLSLSIKPTLDRFAQQGQDGVVTLEVNRALALEARFFDVDKNGKGIVRAKPPTLPVTIQADIGTNTYSFTNDGKTNIYSLNIPSSTFTETKSYTMRVSGRVQNASETVPLNGDLQNGLKINVVTPTVIKLVMADPSQKAQYSTGILPFSSADTIFDVKTLLIDPSNSERPVTPGALFSFADQDPLQNKPSQWFIVQVDGKTRDDAVIALPKDTPNSFRVQLPGGIGSGDHKISVRAADAMTPAFLVVNKAESALNGEAISLSVHPLQYALISGLLLVAAALVSGTTIRRTQFQRVNSIAGGTLILEDELGRRLWTRSLADARRATQTYTKSDGGRGWGRALLDSIKVESDAAHRAQHTLRVSVKQAGQALTPFDVALHTPEVHYPLPNARGGFYLRLVDMPDSTAHTPQEVT